MMRILIVLLTIISMHCLVAGAQGQMPSHEQIDSWWKAEDRRVPNEEFKIKDVQAVILKGGERAFLASVTFPSRARSWSSGILLVRPDLQEARQIYVLAWVSQVTYLADAQVSGVEITGSFNAHGPILGRKSFVYFDDWDTVSLHSRKFGDNLEHCGEKLVGRPCYDKYVTWSFTDLDGDGNNDLVETIKHGVGKEPEQLTWTTEVNAYLLKDKRFIPAPPDLVQSHKVESQRQVESDRSRSSAKAGNTDQSESDPETVPPVGGEVLTHWCRAGLDEAVTTVRSILSQFGLTTATNDRE